MRFENGVFKLFIFWYIIGVLLLSFDLLPSWLEWANAVFLILAGALGALYFMRRFGIGIGLSLEACKKAAIPLERKKLLLALKERM